MEKALSQELYKYILQLDEVEKYNKEIDEAIARVEAGNYTSHDDVKEMSKDW
jgi:hypothetical protein